MDDLEYRLELMGKFLTEMAMECDELNEELGYWRRSAVVCAVLNLILIGVVSFLVFA